MQLLEGGQGKTGKHVPDCNVAQFVGGWVGPDAVLSM
jgi:hypothetical protein